MNLKKEMAKKRPFNMNNLKKKKDFLSIRKENP
jgi:hypothetical protein